MNTNAPIGAIGVAGGVGDGRDSRRKRPARPRAHPRAVASDHTMLGRINAPSTPSRKREAKDLTQCDAISSSKNSAKTDELCASKTRSCRNRSSRKHFKAK